MNRVFVAGTFDHLHAGHDTLLTAAFGQGKPVIIGITSDAFVKQYKAGFRGINPLEKRKKELEGWLQSKQYTADIIPIDDPYEPAASMGDLDTLVVTPDKKQRGEEINQRRKEKGLIPLALLVVSKVQAEDQKSISSTRIRSGEIDTNGRLTLPDNMRPELAKPLGDVRIGDAIGSSIETHRGDIIITVGDITTKLLLTTGVVPALSIVDFLVRRMPYPELDQRLKTLNIYRIHISSGPGFIAEEGIEIIKKWSVHPQEKLALVVTGEEDLLALPAIAYAPVGAVIYYGQPEKGVVEVIVSPEKKKEAIALLERFT